MTTVYLLDDDESVRTALSRLLRSADMQVHSFDSMESLLNTNLNRGPSCIVADIRMPDSNGLELPKLIAARGYTIPVIFVSAQDTEQTRNAAKRAGAVGFYRKPIDAQALLDAIEWASGEEKPNRSSLSMVGTQTPDETNS